MNFSDYLATPERKKQNTWGGVGYYRIVNVSKQITGHEVKVIGKEIIEFGDTIEEQWDNVFKEYDVFWTSYFSDDASAAAIFYHAQKHGKKVIVDVDDNYLDVPESNLLYGKFKKGKKDRAYLSAILSLADVLTVSTEPLKERLYNHIKEVHGIEKPIYVIPNANYIEDWNYPTVDKPVDKFTIGYTGSNSHHDDIQMVLPAIKRIMAKYSEVHFEMLGAIGINEIKKYLQGYRFTDDMLNRMAMVGATPTFKEYPEHLSKQPWDVGICPLVDTLFTRSKSHIKWIEYSMYKIPVIASKVYPYYFPLADGKDTIRDGETGLLVKTEDEWFDAIEQLILNPELGKILGQQAYDYVKDNLQYKDSGISGTVKEILASI